MRAHVMSTVLLFCLMANSLAVQQLTSSVFCEKWNFLISTTYRLQIKMIFGRVKSYSVRSMFFKRLVRLATPAT